MAQKIYFPLCGGKSIRFVAAAIQEKCERLEHLIKTSKDYENEIPDAEMDLAFYRAILTDMRS